MKVHTVHDHFGPRLELANDRKILVGLIEVFDPDDVVSLSLKKRADVIIIGGPDRERDGLSLIERMNAKLSQVFQVIIVEKDAVGAGKIPDTQRGTDRRWQRRLGNDGVFKQFF